uniref:Uncharacterized protein n=1 Tax=Octopus bimaculoides TaxID=37653 RepID=A0A0L8FRG7_OCTBM
MHHHPVIFQCHHMSCGCHQCRHSAILSPTHQCRHKTSPNFAIKDLIFIGHL